jgi:hypothetical protein
MCLCGCVGDSVGVCCVSQARQSNCGLRLIHNANSQEEKVKAWIFEFG